MGWCCLGKVCLGLCFSLLSLSFFNLPILLSPHSGFPQTSSPKVTSLVAFSIMFSFLKKKKKFLIPAISVGPWETGEVNGNSHFSVLKWKPILFQGLSIMKRASRGPFSFPTPSLSRCLYFHRQTAGQQMPVKQKENRMAVIFLMLVLFFTDSKNV